MNDERKFSLMRREPTDLKVYESPETGAIAMFEHDAILDHCNAMLAKSSMENAAMLVVTANNLTAVAPEGRGAYEAIAKAYVASAAKRIMKGGMDYDN